MPKDDDVLRMMAGVLRPGRTLKIGDIEIRLGDSSERKQDASSSLLPDAAEMSLAKYLRSMAQSTLAEVDERSDKGDCDAVRNGTRAHAQASRASCVDQVARRRKEGAAMTAVLPKRHVVQGEELELKLADVEQLTVTCSQNRSRTGQNRSSHEVTNQGVSSNAEVHRDARPPSSALCAQCVSCAHGRVLVRCGRHDNCKCAKSIDFVRPPGPNSAGNVRSRVSPENGPASFSPIGNG